MRTDRLTKLLLGALVVGIWLHLLGGLAGLAAPVQIEAQQRGDTTLGLLLTQQEMLTVLKRIASNTDGLALRLTEPVTSQRAMTCGGELSAAGFRLNTATNASPIEKYTISLSCR